MEDGGARLRLERLVHLEAVLIEPDRLGDPVVRPDDRRVAAGVARRDVVGFDHRDVRDPVARREVVRRRQTVPTATDDDDVVCRLWLVPAERLEGVDELVHRRRPASSSA